MKLYHRYFCLSSGVYLVLLFFIYRTILNSKDGSPVPGTLPESQIVPRHGKDGTGQWTKHSGEQRSGAGGQTTQGNPQHDHISFSNTSTSSSHVVFVKRPSSSQCPNLRRPENVRETFQFQQVDGQNETLVFSAFWDERDHLVRVIAIRLTRTTSRYVCHLWYRLKDGGSNDLTITSARSETLPENQAKKYSAAYIHCPLPKTNLSRGDLPYAVSVTSRDCHRDITSPTNVLRVMTSEGRRVHNFTVCMKPVNMKYSRAYEVVEFIEMSRLLGASKVQVYITSVGPNVLRVLQWYQAQGVVEMIDWHIDKHMRLRQWPPSRNPPEIHAFGQIGASNDCLYRNRKSSRYLVMVDWDEVLVPKKHGTWMELLQALTKLKGRPAGEYRFSCLFFRKDFPARQEDFAGRALALQYRSMVLMVNKRDKEPVKFPARTKYIVDPERIHVTGIHSVHRHRAGDPAFLRYVRVPESLGFNYHYRNWERPSEYSTRGVRDDDMFRFKDSLLRRLKEVWSHFPNLTMDIPLSAYGPSV